MEYLKKKNQNYDARLNWAVTPRCNLNCNYCINRDFRKQMERSLKKRSKIKISSLIKNLDETNKTFRINFAGGEPFLIPNIVEACITITENHFISFFTNLTSKKIKDFAEKINPEKVISICASTHIKELERLNLLDRYVSNFLLCKEKGFNIFASEVAYPQLVNEFKKYKVFFWKKGIRLNFQQYVGDYNGKTYPDSYTEKEIEIFRLDKRTFEIKHQKGNLCNAGYNICMVNPNGDIRYCVQSPKINGNVYDNIKFNDKMIRCPFDYCECPLNVFEPYLFKKAIKETNSNVL